jgi:hypothetical protein
MARCFAILAAAICFVLVAGPLARAAVKAVVEINHGQKATPAFKFKKVPSPAEKSAATDAKFSIVDGEADHNSGGIGCLNDAKLPENQNDAGHNFFFSEGSEGGRVLVDLQKVTDIKQINTYSWHVTTRGPQVYKLYASDGTAAGFDSAPKSGTNPTKVGWKWIATVDTRPQEGEFEGQFGVMLSDSAGTIGKYRYLLFDMMTTEPDDGWGNTFYSRIDVIDADAKPAAGK